MNVLLLGSGGREHAFAWKLSQSPLLTKLYIAPGNPGTAQHGENIAISATDFNALKQVVLSKEIDLVLVGPEDPLVKGIHDFFISDSDLKHVPVIGPTKAGALLEGSKDFSKAFMVRHGVPTARYKSFKSHQKNDAVEFLGSLKPPYVLKADGLAAGKGVIICSQLVEAEHSLNEFFEGAFGDAGSTVVIEEYLHGIEVSVFVLTDGTSYVILPEAKDYKRIGDGDTGPNTGGMGAVSPVPFATPEFMAKVEDRIVRPTIHGLKSEGIVYKGFIFVGIMNVNGDPYVIEYNARMGDPETQVVMPRIKSDFLELLQFAAKGKLSQTHIEVHPNTATAVILVSGGYPAAFEKGKLIDKGPKVDRSLLFHAGTKLSDSGELLTSGGRVFACVGTGSNIEAALKVSYQQANAVCYQSKVCRSDIGKDLM